MEALIALLGIGGIAFSMLYIQRRKYVEQSRALVKIGERFGGGTLYDQGFTMPFSLGFSADDRECELTYRWLGADDETKGSTRLRVHTVGLPALQITPEGIASSIRQLFGAHDVQIGDAELDRRFFFRGASDATVRDLLGPAARAELSKLDIATAQVAWFPDAMLLGRLGPDAEAELEKFVAETREPGARAVVGIRVGPQGITFDVPKNLTASYVRLRNFLESALAFTRELCRRIPAAPPAPPGGQALCPVCSTAMATAVRLCPRCRTPHHRECWDYNEGCAIYGCGSKPGRPLKGKGKPAAT